MKLLSSPGVILVVLASSSIEASWLRQKQQSDHLVSDIHSSVNKGHYVRRQNEEFADKKEKSDEAAKWNLTIVDVIEPTEETEEFPGANKTKVEEEEPTYDVDEEQEEEPEDETTAEAIKPKLPSSETNTSEVVYGPEIDDVEPEPEHPVSNTTDIGFDGEGADEPFEEPGDEIDFEDEAEELPLLETNSTEAGEPELLQPESNTTEAASSPETDEYDEGADTPFDEFGDEVNLEDEAEEFPLIEANSTEVGEPELFSPEGNTTETASTPETRN